MKTCTKCGEGKSLDCFPRNGKCLDGLSSWCKTCVNRSVSEWLKRNPERRREYERRKYANRMKRIHGDNYVVGQIGNRVNRGGRQKTLSDEEKRIRHNVRRITRRAIKSGKLRKGVCAACGSVEVDAHHPDYSQPLSVIWLCKKHHQEVHS